MHQTDLSVADKQQPAIVRNKAQSDHSFFWDDLDALDEEPPLPLPTIILKHGDLCLSILPLVRLNLPNLDLQPLPPGLLLQVLLVLLDRAIRELEPEVHRHRPSVSRVVEPHLEENLIGGSWCEMGQLQLPLDLQPADVLQRHRLDSGFGVADGKISGSEQHVKYV